MTYNPVFDNYPVSKNKTPVNPGETHLPCVLLIDTSGSMRSKRDDLIAGIKEFERAISDDDVARGRVEIEIITFNSKVDIVTPFGPMYDFKAPIDFNLSGITCLYQAINVAINEVTNRKKQYRQGSPKIDYYRPWIFMLTDGQPTDKDNGVTKKLLQQQKDKHLIFFPVAIGASANRKILAGLKDNGVVLTAEANKIRNAFRWLSASIVRTSRSKVNDAVGLPAPVEYDMSAVQMTIKS